MVIFYPNRTGLVIGLLCAFLLALLFYLFGEQQRQCIVQIQLWRENEMCFVVVSKVKVVGLFVCGLTHDFNNLFNVILFNVEMIEEEFDFDFEVFENVDVILFVV